MRLQSVDIELPYNESFYKDGWPFNEPYGEGNQQRPESKTWAAQSRTYWWPAARELVTLLISGYLPTLQLIHQSDCYPLRGRKSCEA